MVSQNSDKVGKLTSAQVQEIVEAKWSSYAIDINGAIKTVAGSARSMGVEIVE